MFPSVKTRFASAARRGFDLAIEFATLGEYGIADAVAPADTAPKPALPRATPVRARASQVKPATPAARRLQPMAQQRRIPTRRGVRELAFDSRGPHLPVRRSRKRAGAARPRPQPCLVADARGTGAMES
jgi:hypothetical protein